LIRCRSRAEDLVFHDARARLARLLLPLADDFGSRTDHGLTIGLELTQQEMAALIGAARQTVSVLLRELVETGAVVRGRRGLLTVDPRGLRRFAEPPAVR
jgi:CRP-like cAMP-binding protein